MELSRMYDISCRKRRPHYYGIIAAFMLSFFCLCTFSYSPVFTSAETIHKCAPSGTESTYVTLNNVTSNISSILNITIEPKQCDCDQGYLYNKDMYGETTITEWNLVCGKDIYDVISNALLYTGFSIGSLIAGPLSDRYGRKYAMVSSLFVLTGFLTLLSLSQNIIMFALLRMVGMMGNIVFAISMFTYCSELASEDDRSTVEGLLMLASSISPVFTTATAFICQHWRCTVFVLGGSMAFFIPIAIIVPESPRWLLAKRRYSAAKKSIAILNRDLDEEEWLKCGECENKLLHEQQEVDDHYSSLDLFRFQYTKLLTLINIALWFVCSMVFYGLSLNSGKLAGNPYVNFLLFGAVEFAGCASILIFAKLRFAKKRIIFIGLLVAGSCCLGSILLSNLTDFHLLATGITIAGKYFATINFNLLFMLTTETYPTVMRSTGLGVSSVAGRVGSIVMPFILYTQTHFKWLTMSLFGVLCLLAGLLALILPNSMENVCLNTLEEAEDYYSRNMAIFKRAGSSRGYKRNRASAASTQAFLSSDPAT